VTFDPRVCLIRGIDSSIDRWDPNLHINEVLHIPRMIIELTSDYVAPIILAFLGRRLISLAGEGGQAFPLPPDVRGSLDVLRSGMRSRRSTDQRGIAERDPVRVRARD